MNDSEDRKEYQRQYYLENRDRISKRKRDKYQNNQEAREKAKESARLYRARKKAENDKLRAEGKIPKSKINKKKPVYININGKLYNGHTINAFAKDIGRGVKTIKNWIENGTIPDTPFRSNRGQRLFTDGMILTVKMIIQNNGIIWFVDKDIYNKVVNEWSKLGIMVN